MAIFIPGTMEYDEEMAGVTRPKRQTRPPARLQKFEVEYTGYRGRAPLAPGGKDVVRHPRERPAQMTSLRSSRTQYDSFHGDAALREANQLAAPLFRMREHSSTFPEHLSFTTRSPEPGPDFHHELRVIQRENSKLLQSQQAFHADLMELGEVRS